MLPQLIASALEQALNRFLGTDSDFAGRLKPMLGKRLALQLRELPFTLQIQFCEQQLVVLVGDQGTPDARVQLSVLDLPLLTDGSSLTELIKQDRLALQGDAALLQQFTRLLKETELNLEELLSRYIGDIPAHQLGSAFSIGHGYLKRQTQEGKANLFEYLTDEIELLPHPNMLATFSRDVKALAEEVDAVAKRLQDLTARVQAQVNKRDAS